VGWAQLLGGLVSGETLCAQYGACPGEEPASLVMVTELA
jgi:hypothetical protein